MRDEKRIKEEIERLDRLRRTALISDMSRAEACAALDALRWAIEERAILSPSELLQIAG